MCGEAVEKWKRNKRTKETKSQKLLFQISFKLVINSLNSSHWGTKKLETKVDDAADGFPLSKI